jgi:hypothetical protein
LKWIGVDVKVILKGLSEKTLSSPIVRKMGPIGKIISGSGL